MIEARGPVAHSEDARQWVHVGSGLFATLLRVLTWWQAAMLAAVALLFNLVLLPKVGGRRLYRAADHARGFPLGILLYPLAVLLLALAFPSRLDIVAAAWGILAFGDGAATLAGHAVKRRTMAFPGELTPTRTPAISARLPWNPDKTVAGTTAFAICGSIGA